MRERRKITVTVYYRESKETGTIIVDAWDGDNAQYPLLWGNKYLGYSLDEVRSLVQEKCREKLKKTPQEVVFEWEGER